MAVDRSLRLIVSRRVVVATAIAAALFACADGALPSRTLADPTNPLAPEGPSIVTSSAPLPSTSAAPSGSADAPVDHAHMHHHHGGQP